MADPKVLGSSGPRGERGHRGEEGPTGPTGPTSSSGGLPVIAAAFVDGTTLVPTFISNRGFLSVARFSTGQYLLQLASPPPNDNCIVNVTLDSTPSVAVNVIAALAIGGVVDVLIQDPSTGNGVDAKFYVTVVDNS